MNQPIGIFDSGLGGLTVYREIAARFPHEDIIYFGDTARVPYGPKSPDTIRGYSIQNTLFLLQHKVKIVVVACNTASSVAMETLGSRFDVKLVGVIEPGARAAVKASRNRRIGVIGTRGTIASGAYERAIHALAPDAEVFAKSCPLFVPIVEEGLASHPVAGFMAEEYLAGLEASDIDTLVLGCTHYPILSKTIAAVFKNPVTLIDSAREVAKEVAAKTRTQAADRGRRGKHIFYVSDLESPFTQAAQVFLNKKLKTVKRVIMGEIWHEAGPEEC